MQRLRLCAESESDSTDSEPVKLACTAVVVAMNLLQTSKQISFPNYIIYKKLRKRETNAFLYWLVESVQGLSEILQVQEIHSSIISLCSKKRKSGRLVLKTFKNLGQHLHLPIFLRPFFPYISYVLLLFFCLQSFQRSLPFETAFK